MKLNFVKMNSQGNDFIIIDNTILQCNFTTSQVRKMASRDSIGCDQLLLLNIKNSNNVLCQIFNQDGSEAYQCGNGLRAIMSFLNKYYNYKNSSIAVKGIKYHASYLNENHIKISMGKPTFLKQDLMQKPTTFTLKDKKFYFHVNLNDDSDISFSFSPIMLGNFHCVVFTSGCYDFRDSIIKSLYDLYSSAPNISFILNFDRFINTKDNFIKLKVNERGAGWTSSCGSGASATAAFAFKYCSTFHNKLDQIYVEQAGGALEIDREDETLYLSGPTSFEYEGTWNG